MVQQFLYNQPESKLFRRQLRKNQTDAEGKIWSILRNRQLLGLKFYRQYNIGKYVLDFFCPGLRLAIEVDGGQHNESEGRLHDEMRAKYLKDLDIAVLRFWNNEVMENFDGTYQRILEEVKRLKNNSSLLSSYIKKRDDNSP